MIALYFFVPALIEYIGVHKCVMLFWGAGVFANVFWLFTKLLSQQQQQEQQPKKGKRASRDPGESYADSRIYGRVLGRPRLDPREIPSLGASGSAMGLAIAAACLDPNRNVTLIGGSQVSLRAVSYLLGETEAACGISNPH